MQTKIKSGFFVFSLILNGIFIAVLVTALFSKSSSLYFQTPPDDYTTAAAVVSLPSGGEASFELITMSLRPGEKAFLQFSFVSSQKQANLLINALFDPGIISVSHAAYGIEITALSEGETLMQTVTNDGIKNVALIKAVK
jgi:hypothetical protein